MNRVQIFEAAARIDDAPALERLLTPIPKHDQLRARFGSEFLLRYYDRAPKADFWVGSDGTVIRCVTIVGIGREDAARVRLLCDQMCEEFGGKVAIPPETIALLVSHVTGGTIKFAN